ncbi:S-type pyocin domain-containing protein [Photobacterium sp. 1_MG-2023]|uniref:S-type pyocin domain-containing protein n=1 Tax=Photobacterium sp. 1_MG-2023 TaxID=3062646 RepID=UPI0026E3A1A3|nr:S-type pyocin domain-containing protein [Photobacterium sp. 1_MG-2023]MDO6707940.1 HNH endonuclease [Photobacterium sp. 1_MG-2023]
MANNKSIFPPTSMAHEDTVLTSLTAEQRAIEDTRVAEATQHSFFPKGSMAYEGEVQLNAITPPITKTKPPLQKQPKQQQKRNPARLPARTTFRGREPKVFTTSMNRQADGISHEPLTKFGGIAVFKSGESQNRKQGFSTINTQNQSMLAGCSDHLKASLENRGHWRLTRNGQSVTPEWMIVFSPTRSTGDKLASQTELAQLSSIQSHLRLRVVKTAEDEEMITGFHTGEHNERYTAPLPVLHAEKIGMSDYKVSLPGGLELTWCADDRNLSPLKHPVKPVSRVRVEDIEVRPLDSDEIASELFSDNELLEVVIAFPEKSAIEPLYLLMPRDRTADEQQLSIPLYAVGNHEAVSLAVNQPAPLSLDTLPQTAYVNFLPYIAEGLAWIGSFVIAASFTPKGSLQIAPQDMEDQYSKLWHNQLLFQGKLHKSAEQEIYESEGIRPDFTYNLNTHYEQHIEIECDGEAIQTAYFTDVTGSLPKTSEHKVPTEILQEERQGYFADISGFTLKWKDHALAREEGVLQLLPDEILWDGTRNVIASDGTTNRIQVAAGHENLELIFIPLVRLSGTVSFNLPPTWHESLAPEEDRESGRMANPIQTIDLGDRFTSPLPDPIDDGIWTTPEAEPVSSGRYTTPIHTPEIFILWTPDSSPLPPILVMLKRISKYHNYQHGQSLADLNDEQQRKVEAYVAAVESNDREMYKWAKIQNDAKVSKITKTEKEYIREFSIRIGMLPQLEVNNETGEVNFDEYSASDLALPEEYWSKTVPQQEVYLDSKLKTELNNQGQDLSIFFNEDGSRKNSWTWHHHQEPGRMQLLPFGIHLLYQHSGGFKIWCTGGRS